jgi:hypothetical protein
MSSDLRPKLEGQPTSTAMIDEPLLVPKHFLTQPVRAPIQVRSCMLFLGKVPPSPPNRTRAQGLHLIAQKTREPRKKDHAGFIGEARFAVTTD